MPKKKANEWKSRLNYEITKDLPKWICLTFSNESIANIIQTGKFKRRVDKITKVLDIKEATGYERDNAIATQAVRWFLERWRKKFGNIS